MTEPQKQIEENVRAVRERIAAAAGRAGRSPRDITLVVVSKMRAPEEIRAVIAAGVSDIGENRVQEAERKKPELGAGFTFHLVGHLQSNKARKAVSLFDVIQSVDSIALAEKIAAEARAAGRAAPVLIEVNTSGEETKFGFDPDAAPAAAEKIATIEGLELQGLMTIGPLTPDRDAVREAFRRTRRLFDTVACSVPMRVLSMGMTDDYETAVEEGSTMVRIGRAIFERR